MDNGTLVISQTFHNERHTVMQPSTEHRETSLRSPPLNKDGERTDGQAHRKIGPGSSTRCAAVDATRMRWVPAEGPKGEKSVKPESSALAAN